MTQTIVIKIGGNALMKMDQNFFTQLKQLQQAHIRVIIVHGGGPMISKACTQAGLTVTKKAGIRVTDAPTRALMTQLIRTKLQPKFLAALQAHGLAAMVLNHGTDLVQGAFLDQVAYGYVGYPTKLPAHFQTILKQHPLVVIGPLCQTKTHTLLNVNADTMAAFVAKASHADQLLLMTDVPGVLDHGQLVARLHHDQVAHLMGTGILKSGMIPKVKAAYKALEAGVAHVEILGDLNQPGTTVVP